MTRSTMPAPPLSDGAVHVWKAHPASVDLNEAWHLLSREECERAARYVFDEHRHFFVRARAITRMLLSSYTGFAAQNISFSEGEFGKPSIALAGAVEFNVSHSGDLLLVAISHRRVGVDVERWSDADDLMQLSETFFAPAEREALLDAADQRMSFFNVWSRKEAYLKASGLGVTHGLDHFAMSACDDAHIVHDERDATAGDRWFIANLDVGPGYSAALVAEKPVSNVSLFNMARR